MIRSLSFDAKKTLRGNFKASTAAERAFYRQLKRVAEVSGHLVDQHLGEDGLTILADAKLQAELKRYSEKLTPWATRQSTKLLVQVEKSNKRAYRNKSKAIGVTLEFGKAERNVREAALVLLNEQVGLIKSIPLEAGLRAQRIAIEAVLHGTRALPDENVITQLQEEMDMSRDVAVNRALLIARTETARANATFNQSRAVAIGSNQYRWHNSGDEAVRPSHKRFKGKPLQGMIFSWDDPPTLDDGMKGHPGTFPNCRCFAEPIFQDE